MGLDVCVGRGGNDGKGSRVVCFATFVVLIFTRSLRHISCRDWFTPPYSTLMHLSNRADSNT